MKVTIINAYTDLGVNVNGASLGPNVIKKHIINNSSIDNIVDVYCDCSNKSNDKYDLAKNFDRLNEYNEELYNVFKNNNKDDNFIITIGGDHSISIATALANIKKEENLGVIWFDTHADFNTFKTTLTGNIHGLPLATITNNNGDKLTKFHNGNYYKNENTVIIGANDIDVLEKQNLEEAGIKVYTADDIRTKNYKELVENAINIATTNTKGIHFSLDIDVLNFDVAPGVSVSSKKGINKEQFDNILSLILAHKDKIKSFDLVEFNPLQDKNQKTEKIVIEVLDKFIKSFTD